MGRGARNLPLYYEGEWDATLPYLPRQVVTVTAGSTRTAYLATASNVGQAPAANPTLWIPLGGDTTPRPHARAFVSGGQTIPTGATDAALVYDGVIEDNAGMWDATNPSYLTVPTTGLYAVEGQVTWPAAAGGGQRRAVLNALGFVSGAYGIFAAQVGDYGTDFVWQSVSGSLYREAGDGFEFLVGQTSGAGLDAGTGPTSAIARMSVTYLGPFA